MIQRLRNLNVRAFNAPGVGQRMLVPPDWIVLGVNNVCNLHCKMCDVGTGFDGSNFYQNLLGARPINMPRDLIFDVIDQTARSFPKTGIGYAFTEPLIYPHLIESLARADDNGLRTLMTTNGLWLPKLADDLCRAGLDQLSISLDGPAEVHNAIRGNKKSFEKAREGIEKIVRHPGRRPRVSVFCTVTEWNQDRLAEMVELFVDLPLQTLGFMHLNFTTDAMADAHNRAWGHRYPATASNMEGIDLDAIDLEALQAEVARVRRVDAPFPVTFSPELNTAAELHRFYRDPMVRVGRRCNDAFSAMMVKSDGSVIPAHGRCYQVVAGNLYSDSLADIWNCTAMRQFRAALIEEGGMLPACTRCCSAF